MKKIAVIGSLNMDLITQTDKVPVMGETLSGTGFRTVCGGKGGNQAAAASKLGGNVAMLGCVGGDGFGRELTERGAKVFFSFPALPHGGLSREELKARTDPFLQQLSSKLEESAVRIISDPADYGFDYTLFFDNHYHMTNEGALVRSEQLVRDLQTALGTGE